jgi:8-oxo-dGTP pyrophosphatase MutT (NUDIX family)
MPEGRPAIPRALARAVKEEAGYRCAIPTCKATSALEIAHIRPWSEVREHTFDNLIYLCAICHKRYDDGEIDRQSILAYKRNLGVVNGRYSDFERRILQVLRDAGPGHAITLNQVDTILFAYLLQDGLLIEVTGRGGIFINGVNQTRQWMLTPAGQDFVSRWFEGRDL